MCNVVYCIDASGSMIRSLPMVLEHLGHSMAQLEHLSDFRWSFSRQRSGSHAQFCRCHWPLQITSVRPFGGCTKRLCSWAIQPQGFEMALAVQPDVIFLLSENITGAGPFEIEADRLLAALEDQNPVRPDGTRGTAIKCVQFLEEDFWCVETNRRGPRWTRRLQLCGR